MQTYDAIVIGGGPGGASSAARLAQLGRRVLLVEKEHFPRYQIGESLLPATLPLLEKIGVGRAIREAGFVEKFAAEFVTFDGSKQRRYPFADGLLDGPPSAYQVERERFDEILLTNARSHGVEVRQGVEARSVKFSDRGVQVQLRPSGETRETNETSETSETNAAFLIDASGRGTLVARHARTRCMDPELQNYSAFTYVKGAARASGRAAGDITIVISPEGWWWLIPLSNDVTSVGMVAPTRTLEGKQPDEDYFDKKLAESSYLMARLEGSTRVAPVRVRSNYSYRVESLAGDRWALVGDAAGFIDPVFSSGAHLALTSGLDAAETIHVALGLRVAQQRRTTSFLRGYERRLLHTMDTYRAFVRGWYGPSLSELLMAPTDKLQLRAAVTTLLAGYGDSNLGVKWRLGVFDALVKANTERVIAERLPGRRRAAATAAATPATHA